MGSAISRSTLRPDVAAFFHTFYRRTRHSCWFRRRKTQEKSIFNRQSVGEGESVVWTGNSWWYKWFWFLSIDLRKLLSFKFRWPQEDIIWNLWCIAFVSLAVHAWLSHEWGYSQSNLPTRRHYVSCGLYHMNNSVQGIESARILLNLQALAM